MEKLLLILIEYWLFQPNKLIRRKNKSVKDASLMKRMQKQERKDYRQEQIAKW